MKILRFILAPLVGALVGWIIWEPWKEDYGFFRDLMLFYFLALGIVLAVLCEQGIFYRKPKLIVPYLRNGWVYVVPFLGALLIKLVFTDFNDNGYRCNEDEVADNVILLLDCSSSMSGEPMEELRVSIFEYLDLLECSDSKDQLATVAFHTFSKVKHGPTNDFDQVREAINGMDPSGGTNMLDGFNNAYGLLGNFDDQEVSITLVSDGQPNNLVGVLDKINEHQNIPVNTIGVGAGYSRALLQEIANNTQGEFFGADDIRSLTSVFKQIAKNGGITSVSRDPSDIPLSPIKRVLGWTLLGLFIGLTIGWIDIKPNMKMIAVIGAVVGGLLSSIIFIGLDAFKFASGTVVRFSTFGLFGIIIGLCIYYSNFIFSRLNRKTPF